MYSYLFILSIYLLYALVLLLFHLFFYQIKQDLKHVTIKFQTITHQKFRNNLKH